MPNKIDSNLTGLRYVEEQSIGVLPGSPVWKPLEPNSYSDFGATVKTVARNPIAPSRQRSKGVVVDVDASSGFNMDITSDNTLDMLQGFMFADWRKKSNVVPSAVAAGSYTVAAGGTTYVASDLIFAAGYSNAVNNGFKTVTASTATSISAAGLVVEATATGTVKKVGFQFAAADATITVTSGVPALNATAKDLTQLGLIPGEWLWIGGDSAATQFATTADNGWYRVQSITATKITFDKWPTAPVADAGAGKTIQVFYGDVIKNEDDPLLIKQRSYQFERSLSTAGYEYVLGNVPNELSIKLSQGDKVAADLSFIATDSAAVTTGNRKGGTFPTIATSATAFNTTSDFSRLRLEKADKTGLASFLTEATITINNGVSPIKALAKMGAVDQSVGDFAVSGSVTALFSDIATVQAVRNNDDATMDFALVSKNAGIVIDIPLLALGNGRLNVEKDKPITIPLSQEAAVHATLRHTLLIEAFSYLPNLADA